MYKYYILCRKYLRLTGHVTEPEGVRSTGTVQKLRSRHNLFDDGDFFFQGSREPAVDIHEKYLELRRVGNMSITTKCKNKTC